MTTVRNQHEDRISGRKDSKKLIITSHIAWASVEARTHLMEMICRQIVDFQDQSMS